MVSKLVIAAGGIKGGKMFEEIPKNRRYAYARVSSKSQEDNSNPID